MKLAVGGILIAVVADFIVGLSLQRSQTQSGRDQTAQAEQTRLFR